jgi:hypothetical protein
LRHTFSALTIPPTGPPHVPRRPPALQPRHCVPRLWAAAVAYECRNAKGMICVPFICVYLEFVLGLGLTVF